MSEHFIKERYLFLNQTDSTNDYLKTLVRENRVVAPFCLHTSFQSLGKGQRENKWQSETGKNVLASFLVDSVKKIELLPHLNKCMALSIVNVLKLVDVEDVSIKWPNDIYVGSSKIAGILIENVIEGKNIRYCVLGVGLNVNQLDFNDLNATSLSLVCKQNFDVEYILKLLFDQFYSSLERSQREIDFEVNNCLYKKGEAVTFKSENSTKEYVIDSICVNGNLQVKEGDKFLELEHHRVKWIK